MASVDPRGGEIGATRGVTPDGDPDASQVEIKPFADFGGDEAKETWPVTDEVPGYRLLRQLGRGAQSVVYLAEHTTTRRLVAIKMMGSGQLFTRSQRARFEREADIVATLKHPGIVVLFDRLLLPGGRIAMVLEYVRGEQLGLWQRERRGSGDAAAHRRRIAELVAGIADAVNHAHQNGVAHRDLKPSNILVDRDDRAHVLDFGVAKLLQQEGAGLTATGDEPATLAYASPEQIDGGAVDQRTDVYSLGVILYELLAERRPFGALAARSAILRAMKEGGEKPLREIEPSIEHDLAAIVHRALEFDPDRRYQSMYLLAADLRRFLNSQPIETRSESIAYLVRRLATEHSKALALAATAFVVVLGSAVSLAVLYERSHRLYITASTEKARADEANERLGDALAMSRVDLGRQLAVSGVVHSGESMLWEQFLGTFGGPGRTVRPADAVRRVAAMWGLREMYHRDPCLATRQAGRFGMSGSIALRSDALVWVDSSGTVVEFDPDTLEERPSWSFAAQSTQTPLRAHACSDGEHMLLFPMRGESEISRWDLRTHQKLDSLPVELDLTAPLIRATPDGVRVLIERAQRGVDCVDFEAGVTTRLAGEMNIRAAEFADDGSIWLQNIDNELLRLPAASRTPERITDLDVAINFEDVQTRSHWFSALRLSPSGDRIAVLLAAQPWLIRLDASFSAVLIHSASPRLGGIFTSDGRLIFPENEQRLAEVNLETGEMGRSVGGHSGRIMNILEDRERHRLVSADSSGVVKWWPAALGPHSRTILPEERSGLLPTHLQSLSGGRVAFSNNAGELRIVDLTTGRAREMHQVHDDYAASFVVDEAGGFAMTVGYDGRLRKWSYPLWQPIEDIELTGETLTSLAVNGLTGVWCAGAESGVVYRGTVAPFKVTGNFRLDRTPRVTKIRFDPDGCCAAIGTGDGRVVIWSPQSGDKPTEVRVVKRAVRRLAWASEGEILVGSDDGLIARIDRSTLSTQASLSGHPGPVAGLEDWPEEGVIVSVDRGGDLKIWDSERLVPLANLRLSPDTVSELALDRESRSIIVVGTPQRISCWSLAETDRCITGNLAYQLEAYRKVAGAAGATATSAQVNEWILSRRATRSRERTPSEAHIPPTLSDKP